MINANELFAEQLKISRANKGFKLLGYVFMPEHIHLVITPEPDTKVGLLIGALKMRIAKKYFQLEHAGTPDIPDVFWQKRCYDHNCRTIDTVKEKINYCHNNPVKRGLVDSPADWIWSSYNWYCGKRDVPILMDSIEI